MAIERHMAMYTSLRKKNRPVMEAMAATQAALGVLTDLEYSKLILAVAAFECSSPDGAATADAALRADAHSMRIVASSA